MASFEINGVDLVNFSSACRVVVVVVVFAAKPFLAPFAQDVDDTRSDDGKAVFLLLMLATLDLLSVNKHRRA